MSIILESKDIHNRRNIESAFNSQYKNVFKRVELKDKLEHASLLFRARRDTRDIVNLKLSQLQETNELYE
jgi:hypothetical protein